jgi:ATP-dependent helicase/nuclease subunit A
MHEAFETGLEPKAAQTLALNDRAYKEEAVNGLSQYIDNLRSNISKGLEQPQETAKKPSQLFSAVKQSLDRRYPFSEETQLPAKSSVTQWTHRNDEYRRLDYLEAIQRKPKVVSFAGFGDARLLGTAAHLVMARLDLSRPITREGVKKVIDDLVSADSITAGVTSRINADSIVRFFESVPGKLAADKSNTILREWPFTFAAPASEFSLTSHEPRLSRAESRGVTSDELIIIQGIIDLLIQTRDGLVVVDFKTDHISGEQSAQCAELYKPQLKLYARAAAAILGDKVLGKWLYFLTPGCAIEV